MEVVCIQEIRKDKITSFLVLLKMKQLLWAYCARSPRGRSSILSAFHFEEVAKKRFPGKTSNNVTVKILGFFLTCHHLNAKEESKILQELDIVTRQLEDTKVWGDAHIWAGDFNSVTRKDYSDTEWVEIGKDRIKLHAKDPKYDDETKS